MTGHSDEQYLFDALAWRLARPQPDLREGAHRGRMRGAGETFADIAPLMAFPDARRLDLRRSLTDPFGGYFVRRFERRTDIVLHILLDASASLAAGATSDRQALAALIGGGLAHAASRGGDRAALHAVAGAQLLAEEPPSRRPGIAGSIRDLIAAATPSGHGVAGLCEAAAALPQRRVLVALISDFDLAADELERLLGCLGPRPILPIWLRDTGLEAPSGTLGLAELRDPETRRRRTVLTTRKWAERQAQAGHRHRVALRSQFQAHGLSPIEIRDSIDVDRLIEKLGETML